MWYEPSALSRSTIKPTTTKIQQHLHSKLLKKKKVVNYFLTTSYGDLILYFASYSSLKVFLNPNGQNNNITPNSNLACLSLPFLSAGSAWNYNYRTGYQILSKIYLKLLPLLEIFIYFCIFCKWTAAVVVRANKCSGPTRQIEKKSPEIFNKLQYKTSIFIIKCPI